MKLYQMIGFIVFCFCLVATEKIVADHEIIIQPDYWEGTQCLANGVPWQVPASIYKEAENCTQEDIVLELGTGGSTIFLAKRCKHVIAVETNQAWAEEVLKQLNKLKIKNVSLHYMGCVA